VIDAHLATYRGIFVGDACGANARLEQCSGGRIVHASCNAHARREFVNAESNDPSSIAGTVVLPQLYDVEERAKTLDAAARWELRQRDSVQVWDACGDGWTATRRSGHCPAARSGKRSDIFEQWTALRVYLTMVDSDRQRQSEQIIRPLIIARQLDVPRPSPCGGGPVADVQRR